MKIYGEAPETVSTSTVTVAVAALGVGLKFTGIDGIEYKNEVGLKISCTFVEILYASETAPVTPLILIGVPSLKLCGVKVDTVITDPDPPFPIELILSGSGENAPTISHS